MDPDAANEVLEQLLDAVSSGNLLPFAVRVTQAEGDIVSVAWASADDDVLMAKLLSRVVPTVDQYRNIRVWCGGSSSLDCSERRTRFSQKRRYAFRQCDACCRVTRESFGELTIDRVLTMVRDKHP